MLVIEKEWINKIIKHLELEFSKLQLWRANPAIIEDLRIEQYGSIQLLKNVASISNLDSQTLSIKSWDKAIIWLIWRVITDSGLWLNPQSTGDSIIIKFPLLTQERRLEISKIAKKLAEESKVSLRNLRAEYLKNFKSKLESKEFSEDIYKWMEKDLQDLIVEFNLKIDTLLKKKQDEIMKI